MIYNSYLGALNYRERVAQPVTLHLLITNLLKEKLPQTTNFIGHLMTDCGDYKKK